ncbi:MAG: TlpA family protein disulfide reductase [Prevotella sp.]|jgi:thiol-disulfide isomerase/thioredoxin|nr:TlpA family protein disulfide reductase [Prevotella sp.]
MTKKLLFTLFIFVMTLSGCSQKKEIAKDVCLISIETQNYQTDSISLMWSTGDEFKNEIILLKEGKGEIEIKTPELTNLYLMNLDNSKSVTIDDGMAPAPMFCFFAENGHQINISFNNNDWPVVKISGGSVNNDYMLLLKETGMLEKTLSEKQVQTLMTKDTTLQKSLDKELTDLQDQIINKKKAFLQANTSSYVSLFILQELVNSMPFDEFEKYFMSLDNTIRDTQLGQQIVMYIENSKKTGINQPAPDFEKKDKDGKVIKLSDYKGKYVLIDFWGSWCGPCRESHSHLVELYKKYSSKSLQFIGIAHENTDDKKNWLAALKKDGLVWTQILNNEGIDKSDVITLYNITAFPTKILINPEGKIEGRYTGTELNDMDAKLTEIFGN